MDEPIIEELATTEELHNLRDEYKDREFLGYYYNCPACQNDGYLNNQHQAMCPKCGAPFFFDQLDEEGLTPCWKESEDLKFTKLKKVLYTKEEKEEIIVEKEEDWKDEHKDIFVDDEQFKGDYITDAT